MLYILLQLLLRYWHVIPDIVLWKFTLKSSPVLWIYCIIHATFWLLIYVGCICVDINELLGIKQVIFYITLFPINLKRFREYLLQLHLLHSHLTIQNYHAFYGFRFINQISQKCNNSDNICPYLFLYYSKLSKIANIFEKIVCQLSDHDCE